MKSDMDAPRAKKRVAFIITGLGVGGAEKMLLKVLRNLDRSKIEMRVITLSDRKELLSDVLAIGIDVIVIGARGWHSAIGVLRQVRIALKEFQPDVIQGWMYHANVVGSLAALLLHPKPLVFWNVRAAQVAPGLQSLPTRILVGLSRFIASQPQRILNNSFASAAYHASAFGYPPDSTTVIPNGFDVHEFQPDSAARVYIRADLGIPQTATVIGMIARLDPAKDHGTFLRAASKLAERYQTVHFLLAGQGVTPLAVERICHSLDIPRPPRLYPIGVRKDIAALNAALDIATLSSQSEGFPNAIGEAMCCAIPCAVTDVGDCAALVGDTGIVVPHSNPELLANAWNQLIEMPAGERLEIGRRARERIKSLFSVEHVAAQYESIYLNATRK